MKKEIYYRESWWWFGFAYIIFLIAGYNKWINIVNILGLSFLTVAAFYNLSRPKREKMEITNKNIQVYKTILDETNQRFEIIKYLIKRLFGIKSRFSENVLIYNKNSILNCGRIMGNVKVAISSIEDSIFDGLDLKDKLVIDIGANIGKYTILLSKLVGDHGEVISFEPLEETFNLLKNNCNLNNRNNIKLIKKVCSNKKGETVFYIDILNPATNSIYPQNHKQSIIVESDKIDNMISENQNVALIKVDVEGAELEVLIGAEKLIKRDRPIIIFEAWNDYEKKKIEKFLGRFNYEIKHINMYNYRAYQK